MAKPLIQKNAPISGINVTPIIDVALVLVIILLITAPVMSISDLDVELPGAHTRGAEEESSLHITLAASGEISLDRERIAGEALGDTLRSRLARDGEQDLLVVVRADQDVTHDDVQSILETARGAGARRLAVATTLARQEASWRR